MLLAVRDTIREPTFLILTVLGEGPSHGYRIMVGAAELSEGRVRLSAGTVYGALDRLRADGLVEPAGEQVEEGRKRKLYRLTAEGAGALAAEAGRRKRQAEAALTRLADLGFSR
jgi:DNA-binding PadR family transcriptional regulator